MIQAGDGKENKAAFQRLLAELQEHLQPVGPLEEMLVEKIAVSYWRLRRVLRCESGEIRQYLDTAESDYYSELERHATDARDSDDLYDRWRLRDNSIGLSLIIAILDEVREEVTTLGRLSEAAYSDLAYYFGEEEDSLTSLCKAANQVPTAGAAPDDSDQASKNTKKRKERILKILDEERERLEQMRDMSCKEESLEVESQLARLSLPDKEETDKLLRHETALDRQLYRAMNQLERLQRMRRGETVPPPISLEISAEK
ncbi:MAG: hypothetical protein HY313_06270 [Acidobacteria bacterium]|nr:hypothetical protein [Acidobacteriota bacterium]